MQMSAVHVQSEDWALYMYGIVKHCLHVLFVINNAHKSNVGYVARYNCLSTVVYLVVTF